MDDQLINQSVSDERYPWKRIAGQVVEKYTTETSLTAGKQIARGTSGHIRRTLKYLGKVTSLLILKAVHSLARIANRPVVDIGREYSVSALNERINILEEVLVRQWSQLKDGDFLTPNDEIKQYIAACHVARQYDRITTQLLSSRLGVSKNEAEQLMDQLLEDEVITESYTVTYHDVRRTMIDATIERKLTSLHPLTPTDSHDSRVKKH